MSINDVVDIARGVLWIIVKCSSPMLLVSLIVGLVISIFQTVTSIQEQTLVFVPKFIAMFIVLALVFAWICISINEFTIELFHKIPEYINS